MTRDDILVLCDIETTGLNPRTDRILEVGIKIIDLDFKPVAYYDLVVSNPDIDMLIPGMDKFVLDMHTENGLLEATKIQERNYIGNVAEAMREFLDNHDALGQPMTGSSLALDRAFLSEKANALNNAFHYRSIDVSTIKELCRRFNPPLYAKLPGFRTDHRVENCLNGTAGELQFYTDNFFFDGRTDG